MWFRSVLLLLALALGACSPTSAREQRAADRAADVDHDRCAKKGLKPGSAKYVTCRKQLAGRRAAEPAADNDDEGSWWSQDPHEYSCKFWGYKPGTAVFEECVAWSKRVPAPTPPPATNQTQGSNCVSSGSATVTRLTGDSFMVTCPGQTIICPGGPNCPVVCPGSAGCPR